MDFQKVIAVATRRGIFQSAFDAYGGLAGFIDYGPVGVKMRRRILETWRKLYVSTSTFGNHVIYVCSLPWP